MAERCGAGHDGGMKLGWGLPFVWVLIGCGSEAQPPAPTTDASSDVGIDVEDPFSTDGGFVQPDASVDSGPIRLRDGGGPFLCHGCPCDGTTHWCDDTTAGPPVPTGDGGCEAWRCKPYPSKCGANPTCACLEKCSCARAPNGDGLIAGCHNP